MDTYNPKPLEHISAILPAVLHELSFKEEAPGPRVAAYGFAQLDDLTDGLHGGDLIVLGSRPGMGKSSLAMNIMANVGKQNRKNVVFFSLEMAKECAVKRMIAQEGYVDLRKMAAHRLENEDWERISAAALSLDKMNIYIDDSPTTSVSDMEHRCRQIPDVGLIVVDYFQLISPSDAPETPDENDPMQERAAISADLKGMARRLDVPVLCLSQLPRSIEARPDKKPVLRDLRDIGTLEHDADVVIMLYRDAYYDCDTEFGDLAECIVVKNRHGETWRAELQWLYRYATFANLEDKAEGG